MTAQAGEEASPALRSKSDPGSTVKQRPESYAPG
jgi:hypothetical protein